MRKPSSAGFVAYYRVSTDRQRASGLGLEAQQAAVSRFIGDQGPLLAEFTEIESGKSHRNRPQLQKAIEESKRRKAKLVIAKLDRLARNVHFVSGLMESHVDFVAADMPHANKLTIHIFAAAAEHERDMISQRTKDALAAARARGVKLGNPRWRESIRKASAARGVGRAVSSELIGIIRDLRGQKKTLRGIAEQLNGLKLSTPSGSRWHASTVRGALLASGA